jgi:hypothetical protein
MFRKPFATRAASLCGLVASVAFFIAGIRLTLSFGRWDPYARIDWQQFMDTLRPSFGADFFLHSFMALVAMGALFFLLALGTRTSSVHPTSTAMGVGFLGLPMVLMTLYSVWQAFGKDLVMQRYHSTQDEAFRQTLQHLFQVGYLDTPVLLGMMAYFSIVGFAFLGNAFRREGGLPLALACWLSALTLLAGVLVLGYGYDRIFTVKQFPRTLMTWGHLGIWVIPTITLAICSAWLWLAPTVTAAKVEEAPPSMPKAA